MSMIRPVTLRRHGLLMALLFTGLLLSGCGTNTLGAAPVPTFAPTETSSPLMTSTPVPVPPPVDLPAVDWSDLSVYKQAMKPEHASDVDRFGDSNRYLILAAVKIETDAVIRGAERVRYTNRSDDTLNTIVFRLYPNSSTLGGTMNVTRVTLGGKPIEPEFSSFKSIMTLTLEKPLAKGESVEMTVDFNTVMSHNLDTSYGRYGFVSNVVSGTAWYPTLSVYDKGSGWWTSYPSPQGDPAYTETGLYDVRLTLPSTMTTVMSGLIIDKKENGDGTTTYRDVTGPMRDFAFQASDRYMITSQTVDGTRINVMHYRDKAGAAADGTPDVVKFSVQSVSAYNKAFGDYPYAELDVVENPTPSGVEFPGLVQITQTAWIRGNSYLESVVAHEIGHQWFYALVGNDQVNHPWIDESLTSYTEIVYWRAYYSADKADEYVNSFQRRYLQYTGSRQPDKVLDLPVKEYSDWGYGAIVYAKGPMFYVELERQLGRDVVAKALTEYFHRMQYKIATTADVKKAFEDISGKDLTDLFKKWVTG